MKFKSFLIVLFVSKSFCSYAQPVPLGTEMQELVKIVQVYQNVPYLSFDLKYTFADSLTWQTHTDSMLAAYKLSYGKSFMTNSNFEFLKGNQYDVLVDKDDSSVFVTQRKPEEGILSVPLLDSMFYAAHVDSVWIFSVNDSNWVFMARFRPQSFYSYYEMRYDPRTGLIKMINFHAQNISGAHNIPNDHVACVFIYMTNYSEADLDPTIFNEAKYFYRLNGSLFLQPAWQEFELENF